MLNTRKVILTPQGKQKLEQELADLRIRRPAVVAEVQRARAMGDLKENSAYQANRDKLRSTDRRLVQLELLLRQAHVIEKTDSEAVQLGSRIVVESRSGKIEYEIVGESEANPKEHKVSLNSPLGKAFLGRQKGEQVEVLTPAGKHQYIILEIS